MIGQNYNIRISPIARAALAVGADGIMVETYHYPELALSDNK